MAESFSQLASRVLKQNPIKINKKASPAKGGDLSNRSNSRLGSAAAQSAGPKKKISALDSFEKNLIKYANTHDDLELSIVNKTKEVSEDKITETTTKPTKRLYRPNKNGMTDWEVMKAAATPEELKDLEEVEERAKPLHQRKAFKQKMQHLDNVIKDAKKHYNIIQEINQLKENEPKLEINSTPDPDLRKGLGEYASEEWLNKK